MTFDLITGDARTILPGISAAFTPPRVCITSPPYYGLRNYGHDAQIGREQTPTEYIANLVGLFRTVRDVLADDGTLWLNLGDSYASTGGTHSGRDDNQTGFGAKRTHAAGGGDAGNRTAPAGMKPKDLMMIPARVAIALQADGWYLRSDIVWNKPNTMPESVTDRPTRAHEFVFLLAKSSRYYYNADAVREPAVSGHSSGNGFKRPARESYTDGNGPRGSDSEWVAKPFRNRRDVWTINTRPFKAAHFATMPVELAELCVLAGSEPGDLVLDPFSGAGTTGVAALKNGRRYLGIELNPDYVDLSRNRLDGVTPSLFAP